MDVMAPQTVAVQYTHTSKARISSAGRGAAYWVVRGQQLRGYYYSRSVRVHVFRSLARALRRRALHQLFRSHSVSSPKWGAARAQPRREVGPAHR